jgi:hypothetical protein
MKNAERDIDDVLIRKEGLGYMPAFPSDANYARVSLASQVCSVSGMSARNVVSAVWPMIYVVKDETEIDLGALREYLLDMPYISMMFRPGLIYKLLEVIDKFRVMNGIDKTDAIRFCSELSKNPDFL